MVRGVKLTDKMCWTRMIGQSPQINKEIETARRTMLNINLNLRMFILYTIRNRCGMIAAYVHERRGHDVKHFQGQEGCISEFNRTAGDADC